MESEFSDITPEEIKELLSQSGYLFEQQVASLIEKEVYVVKAKFTSIA
jgi:hypothetical protein